MVNSSKMTHFYLEVNNINFGKKYLNYYKKKNVLIINKFNKTRCRLLIFFYLPEMFVTLCMFYIIVELTTLKKKGKFK